MGKVGRYFSGVIAEGKRVRWPKGVDLWSNIAVVVIITVFIALCLALDDLVAAKLLGLLEQVFKGF